MINYFELKKWYIEYKEKINDSIIKNIFNEGEGIIFEIYKKGLEYKYLYIIPGKIIFLHNLKEKQENNKFILKLRKDFINKKINIELDENDKIIIINFGDKRIYFELFPNGLVVITDKDNKILYANKYKNFGVRKIFKGEIYMKPPNKLFITESFDEFLKKIKESNKKDIVRTLAIDFSLGGKYAEYILEKTNINKEKNPKELNENEIKEIFELYKKVVKLEMIIDDRKNPVEDINKYFIELYFNKRENEKIMKLNEEKQKILNIINEQKKYLEEIDKEIKHLEKIAEFLTIYSWVFENYEPNELRKKFMELNIDINISKNNKYLILNINDNENVNKS
ncbi:MAG: hypothetical protein ACP5G1_00840 [Nanopusillaceae archaeon]